MEKEIIIVPGESINEGSANIRYPEGQILNVKGFYEQDSHIMPKFTEMKDGDREWVEVVPEGLDLSEKHPLVISWHGGGQSGWGQLFATSWHMVAEKYGLVAFYPNHGRDSRGPEFAEFLINYAKEKYNIDEKRVFIQGMSAGNMMTSVLSRTKPELFAGAGMSAGPDNTTLFTDPDADLSEFGPIPVYQSRGERDTLCPSTVEGINRRLLNMSDRDFWLKVNGCDMLPAVIKIDGRNNYMVYRGTKADVVYRDVKWRGHGQTIDDAEQMWRQLFSGVCRNENNEVVMGEPIEPLKTDEAVILAADAGNAFLNSEKKTLSKAPYELLQYMEVPETMLERMPELKDKKNVPSYGPFLYAAAEDIAALFGFEAEYSYEGQRVILKKEGYRIQISAGNVASTVNGVIKNLERQAELKDGTLYIPVRSIAEYLKKVVIMQDGVWYVTDHSGEMTGDFAAFIKGYLA